VSRPEPARHGILVEARSGSPRLTFGFFDAYPPAQVSITAPARIRRCGVFFALVAVVACLAGPPAAAQTFAVGGGGSLMSDQGKDVVQKQFVNWGGNVFGEVALGGFDSRQDGVLQLRFSYRSLPGGAPDAPKIDAWSGLALVCYRFKEFWWEGGFFGGVGLYRILPKSLEPGQVPADPTQTVIGAAVGAQTLFRVSSRFDIRLELSGEFPSTEYSHTLVVLTTAVGYRF